MATKTKAKTAYFCKSCGNEFAKWMGQCPACKEWNTLIEELVIKDKSTRTPAGRYNPDARKAQVLSEVSAEHTERISSLSGELDRVLGGGMVPGSVILLGGEPGIGKSTLTLQVAMAIDKKVLYVSGEESLQQIKLRAERLGENNPQCYLLNEVNTDHILQQLTEIEPDLVIIDSIQTLFNPIIDSTPGSISQIRECTAEMMRYAKETSTPVILIGHITKDGNLAGPKILEHMVDTVMQFEGDRNHAYRLLRSTKNRFGSTHELGIFEMAGTGLEEVTDPSKVLTTSFEEAYSGIAVGAMLEGLRPMLIELQALVSSAVYGTPQRSATGFDTRRLNMLLAVLEKRGGFKIGAKDVFLNVAGGLRVEDPGLDLAVAVSVMSSYLDISIDSGDCFAAEIGLSGELRPASRIQQRISEAAKLGYKRIFVSKYGGVEEATSNSIQIIQVGRLQEVFSKLFKGG
ncbi:MAG: DNA repair protein RadA [Flavobacteriales bacterium]|nr:DNA repair protein RadA [Flavobacteriales bacterium]